MRRGLVFFLAFSAATFLAVYFLPAAWLPWLALGFGAGLILLFWRKTRMIALAMAGICLAFLWFWGYRTVFFSPAEDLAGRRTEITLRISDYPQPLDYGARVHGWAIQPGRAPVDTLFYGAEELLELVPGDTVTVTTDCSLANRLYGEEVRYYTSKGTFLRAFQRGDPEVVTAESALWWALPAQWGHALAEGIRTAFPGEVGDLAVAIVTGDRSGLDEGRYFDLARCGAAHTVAVSGMHICFLVSLLSFFTGRRSKRRAAVCIPVVLLFALAVGASPSVLRASVFQLALLVAPLVRREPDKPTLISGTLFLLLLLNPYSAANIGLQLSFAAVVGIELITPRLGSWFSRFVPKGDGRFIRLLAKALRFLWATLATTLGAMLFTLPLSLFYFETLSFISPIVNLLLLPAVSILFVLGLFLGILALVFPGAASVLGFFFSPIGWYILRLSSAGAALPYSAVTLTDVYYPALVAAVYALILIAVFWKGARRRAWIFLSAGAVMTLSAILFTSLSFQLSPLSVTVLDVGQGQSVVLASQGKTCLVDCGGNSLDDPGDIAANYLLDRGHKRLDLLVLTHFHDDHAGGLETLFRRLEVKAVAIPDTDQGAQCRELLMTLAEEEGCPVTFIREDTEQALGEATLRLYAPLGDGGANEEGLSVLASLGEFDILLTGDMNTVVEEQLVKYGDLPDCEVLVAGHHGSRYASGTVLLDAITPEVAILSVGRNNYGHPAEETLERLARRGVTVYRTDEMGNITLRAG